MPLFVCVCYQASGRQGLEYPPIGASWLTTPLHGVVEEVWDLPSISVFQVYLCFLFINSKNDLFNPMSNQVFQLIHTLYLPTICALNGLPGMFLSANLTTISYWPGLVGKYVTLHVPSLLSTQLILALDGPSMARARPPGIKYILGNRLVRFMHNGKRTWILDSIFQWYILRLIPTRSYASEHVLIGMIIPNIHFTVS